MKLFLIVIAFGLASAATLRTRVSDLEDDDVPSDAPTDPSYTIFIGRSAGLGHRCWTKIWVVKICTFITPEELSVDGDEISDETSIDKESESCDELGCNMFCQKNHLKKGVCHKTGCECIFE